MIAIQLRFPTGKMHATPWGRQVNEGVVEWPPSPWRLQRALLAVWHRKFPDIPRAEVQRLFGELQALPSFQLPCCAQGHTRHYMPLGDLKSAKIFDTFVALPRETPLIIAWPQVELESDQQNLLAQLLGAMAYFGRAESWVDAKMNVDWDGELNCRPLDNRHIAQDEELVRLLSPLPEEEFIDWRDETRRDMETKLIADKKAKLRQKGKADDQVKLTNKERERLNGALPETIFDALHAETGDIRSGGWSRPPGSRWVDYTRPRNAFAIPATGHKHRQERHRPCVARYAVAGSVLPLLTEAVFIGERIRTALMSHSRAMRRQLLGNEQAHAAEVFSGKSNAGIPLNGHQHAHFLPEARTTERHISHVTVWAPGGFGAEDEVALSRMRKVWGDGGHDLQFVLLGVGDREDFGGLDERKGQSLLLATSTQWVSRTPFVPTDHLRIRKREMRDPVARAAAEQRELERLIRKELQRRDWLKQFAETVEITRIPHTSLGGTQTVWMKFRRERHKGQGTRSSSTGYGFQLTFPKPVPGPIALGYGCHFGLGTFVPRTHAHEHESPEFQR